MKKVFNSLDMVCHVWAQRNQEYGRTSNNNIFFRGDTIYSYGHHFPLATFIEDANGVEYVLYNDDSYSVSTSNHQSILRRATGHYSRINCDTKTIKYIVDNSHNKHDKRFKKSLQSHVVKNVESIIATQAQSASKRRAAHLKQDDITTAIACYNNACKLLSVYSVKMPKRVTNKIEELQSDTKNVYEKHCKELIAADKKRKREQKKREQERQAKAKEAVAVFISGEKLDYEQTRALTCLQDVYMRPEADGNIYTTQRASFPIEHAIKAFEFIRACKDKGEMWQRNGKTIRLGNFQIDRIDESGNVRAGCHFVKWQEIERVATVLNIYP